MSNRVLSLYRRLENKPFGKRLFSKAVCLKAPYFGSIQPRVEQLEPGRGVASISHRRAVTNHLGTVHAIAMCNLAEFIGGLVTEVSVPSSMRWIPKGMTVAYEKKAVGNLRGTAEPVMAVREDTQGYELPVQVTVTNVQNEKVFTAVITMWVSPKKGG